MQHIQNLYSKKSLKIAISIALAIFLYFSYISTIVEVTEVQSRVIFCEIIACFFVCLLTIHVPKKYIYLYNFCYIVILSFFTSIMLDFLNGTFEAVFEETISVVMKRHLLSTLIVFLLYVFMVALFKNMKTACVVGCVAFIIVGILGYIIFEFRGSRLLFADFLAVETALDVVGSYNIIPVKTPLLLGIVSIFCLIPTLFKIRSLKQSYKSYRRIACYLLFAFGFFGLYHSSFDSYFYSWVEGENSYAFSFFANLKFMEVKPSKDYKEEEVIEKIKSANPNASILDTKFNPDEEIKAKFPEYVAQKGTTDPNIIVVMNESLTDLDVFGETNTNSKIFTYLNSLPNTVRGNTFVDVRGGGTADTEYDFLTGNTTKILPLNARPYQFYINPESLNLVTYLDSLGYYTIAMHPGSSVAWNRHNVYNTQFGFDETIFIENYPFDDTVRLPIFKSDFVTYKKIIDIFNSKQNLPYFIFDVTIQNHGGYSNNYTNLNKVDLGDGATYPDEVIEFLSLMKRSDSDFQVLIDYFQNLSEPTVVLMFGDHQPKFTANFPSYVSETDMSIEKKQSLYETPFVIWANYALPSQKPIDLSINYLSTLLLECGGIDKPAYHNYLANLYQNINVINRFGIITDKGEYYSFEEKDIPEKYQDLINEFDKYSYYTIFDQNIRDFADYSP